MATLLIGLGWIQFIPPWSGSVPAEKAANASLHSALGDPATIAAYREAFPWIRIEVIEDAGQLIFFQKFRLIVPRMAEFAHAGQ